MNRVLQTIYSILVWILITLVTLSISTLMIIASFALHFFDPDRRITQNIASMWGKTLVFLNPTWSLKIQGRGYIRDGKSYIMVANHSSLSDIICLYCMGKQFKWVAKDSLFRIPFFGWAMSAARYVRLVRGKHKSIKDSFEKCFYWLQRDMPVLIFPEGTRSVSGKLSNFKNGAFKLAIQAKKPIVPIVLIGTREVIEKGSARFASNIHCKIKVLKPIQTSTYREEQYQELRNLVREKMLEVIDEEKRADNFAQQKGTGKH